jgi:SMC interacting uncharacterized protein involved in chromosome segregation
MGLFSKKRQQQIETGTIEDLREQRLEIDRQIEELRDRKRALAREIDSRLLEEQSRMDPGQIVRMGQ